ncbi:MULTISPECIES: transcriptional regulator [unclassified Streptomyces]|uniref:transcriptional regulator n=1 Tax=unclassified Streptomyces TaxID=2593676 RepID=UPI00093D43C0|nr:transcriptional regulator [Streptomyces sp. TSRI0107]OKJ90699.1 transcriptional regulator [Streptomyces sp. TSRI0107]
MEPNTLLDALLDEAGISRKGLASRINQAGAAHDKTMRYDHSSVIRWLRGQRPRGVVPDLICDVLSARLGRPLTVEDIGMGRGDTPAPASTPLAGFIERSAALWRSDQQQRRDVQQAPVITGLPAVGPVWEWENPPDDTDVSRPGTPRVVMCDVESLRQARGHYEQMYRRAGGVVTKARVLRFLNTEAAPLLRGAYSDATGRELHRTVGGLVAVAGICSYDSDAQGLAQRYFHQALRLAKASGDRAFGGYIIALLVNQALYMRDYRQAVAFAEAGLRAAGNTISPGLACDLHAMQAKAFSRMGDHASARRAMTAAEVAASHIRPDEEPAETGYVQPGLLEVNLADALMRLGDTGPAQAYAAEAVATQTHERGRVHRLATLTDCQLRAGHAEQAAATATTVLDSMQGMESLRLRDRLVKMRRVMTGLRSTATAEVVERIDDTLRIPL